MTIAQAIVEDDLTSWDVLPVLTMIEARCKHNILTDIDERVDAEVGEEVMAIQELIDQLQQIKEKEDGSGGGIKFN